MGTLRDEQIGYTNMIQSLARLVASQWTTQDKREPRRTWTVLPIDPEHVDCMRVIITDGDGVNFSISTGHPYEAVICRPVTPLMPNLSGHGGMTSLSELLPYEYRKEKKGVPDVEAGVSLTRVQKDPDTVARDFWRRSAKPYLEVLPMVNQTLAARQKGIDEQRAVAQRLVDRHPGFRIGNIHGDSIPVYGTSSVSSDLPGLHVQFGGRIMTDRAFSMSERVLDALIAAVNATTAAAPEKKKA
jgi:hypothetical protein